MVLGNHCKFQWFWSNHCKFSMVFEETITIECFLAVWPLPSMVFQWFLILLTSLSLVFDGSRPLVKRCDGFNGSLWSKSDFGSVKIAFVLDIRLVSIFPAIVMVIILIKNCLLELFALYLYYLSSLLCPPLYSSTIWQRRIKLTFGHNLTVAFRFFKANGILSP